MAIPVDPTSSATLAELSERQRERALDRYRKLRPHLEQDAPLARVAKEASLPLRTAQHWVSRYRRFGLAGLTRASRSDQGRRRRVPDDLLRLAEGLALQRPPFSPSAVYREVCRVARARGEQPPGYHTIYNVIRAIPDDLKTLAVNGEKSYREAYDLVHRREAERPNQIWQADHTQLDLWAKRADGQTARPWLTVVIDDYSRAIAGFFVSFDSPSAARTALALRQAIWRKSDAHWIVFGIPEIFYTDNGSDFTSIHLEQVAADIKMRLIFSAPGQPRGRGRIERFFETVNQMFLCTLPGYIGAGAVRGRPELTVSDLERGFRDFLREYHARPHGETKIAPQVRWQHGSFVPRMAESLEQLDLLLLAVAKARKIQADGVRFQGMRYIDPNSRRLCRRERGVALRPARSRRSPALPSGKVSLPRDLSGACGRDRRAARYQTGSGSAAARASRDLARSPEDRRGAARSAPRVATGRRTDRAAGRRTKAGSRAQALPE